MRYPWHIRLVARPSASQAESHQFESGMCYQSWNKTHRSPLSTNTEGLREGFFVCSKRVSCHLVFTSVGTNVILRTRVAICAIR